MAKTTISQTAKVGQPPTAKELRQRVADVTTALKGYQREWKALTYAVAAGEAGARERLETLETTIGGCDRELALLYAAVEEAENRETAAKRSRVAALEAALESLLMDIGARLSVARRTLLSLAHASDEALLEAYGLMRQDVALANELQNLIGGLRFRRAWSFDQFGVVAAICDELAFWRTEESANPDTEILAALRPAMATVENALLLALSSPHARRGELWTTYRKHFGKNDDPILVWCASTLTMNSLVPKRVILDALEADEPRAQAEYYAQFRRDIETFISAETLEAARAPERRELRPISGCFYLAFVDPSGGSSDSFTLAIGHQEARGQTIVVDLVREQTPPFSPEVTVASFVDTLRAYGISRVWGDRYAGEWPREQFRKGGIGYEISEMSKSDLYLELLPLLNSTRVEVLDHPRLLAQLGALERRTARGGRDSVDHAPGSHDDLANAVAGVCVHVARHGGAAMDLARILFTSEDQEWAERRRQTANGERDDGDASGGQGSYHEFELGGRG